MRRSALIWAVATIAMVTIGCVTTGDIPVDLAEPPTVYISPGNGDGVQDNVTYGLSVDLFERTVLSRYAITVIDSDGFVSYSEAVDDPAEGLLGQIRGAGIEPPEVIVWDGRDDNGESVPDGEYRLTVRVWDNRENTGGTEQRVVVDNTAPHVELSAPSLRFTPDGDNRLEELSVLQRQSSVEDLWVGRLALNGQPLREYSWPGVLEDFRWDGVLDDGTAAPEGMYTYSVAATDRAGNTAEFRLDGIELAREPRPISLSIGRTVFSPNGDGRADTLALSASIPVLRNLQRWEIQVGPTSGGITRTFSGTGEPGRIVFDGLDDQGEPAPDGVYRAVLKAIYSGGRNSEIASPDFRIDTVPPQASVEVSSTIFSPDGDGRKDSIEIRQDSSAEGIWTGTFRRANGSVLRSQTWAGQAENFLWDGAEDSGAPLPDGIYTYELTAEDEGGSTAELRVERIRIDTRPVSVRIVRSEARISPNADDFLDTVTLGLFADEVAGIEQWGVTLNDASGANVGVLATGTDLPPSLEWDGLLDGQALEDGLYYPALEVIYLKGTVATALGSSVRLDTTGPEISITLTPEFFSPDGDGYDDVLTMAIWAADPSSIDGWEARILDPSGRLLAEWSGAGRPPTTLQWDGTSPTGIQVEAAVDYRVVLAATDTVNNSGSGETVIPIDILVTRDGDRIRISSIYFEAYTAGFENLDDPVLAQRNVETLDRLAHVLQRYPQYVIRIEGHATHLLSFDPMMAQTENLEVLVPLSFARAEAIRAALVRRGIPRSRMTVFGYGGVKPVVPHTDELNRWQNRRVEFILVRR